MSNPKKTKIYTEEEINENSDDSVYLSSDEEGEVRELILALPALRFSESFNDQAICEKAVVASQLVMAVAEEVAVRKDKSEKTSGGKSGTSENIIKKKVGRPRKVKLDVTVAEGEPVKKPRKKGSNQLNHPPQGPPKCNICGRCFGSWKGVFGHLRSHKDRGYLVFFPPPTFNAAEEGFGRVVAASSGGSGGLDIDLNVDPLEKEEGTGYGSGSSPKFDLNMSPPKDDKEDKEDKAK